jgi:hypothetical protein
MCWCPKRVARPALQRFRLRLAAGRRGPPRAKSALVPTARGLYRLWINPVNETCRTEAVLAAPVVAAPGLMRRQLACLVRNSAGG